MQLLKPPWVNHDGKLQLLYEPCFISFNITHLLLFLYLLLPLLSLLLFPYARYTV